MSNPKQAPNHWLFRWSPCDWCYVFWCDRSVVRNDRYSICQESENIVCKDGTA